MPQVYWYRHLLMPSFAIAFALLRTFCLALSSLLELGQRLLLRLRTSTRSSWMVCLQQVIESCGCLSARAGGRQTGGAPVAAARARPCLLRASDSDESSCFALRPEV